MSELQGRIVSIDTHLSNIAINYRPPGGIAMDLFPIVPVQKQNGLYPTYTQADLFLTWNDKRARGDTVKKITWTVGSASYYCENYGLGTDVILEDRINADPVFVNDFEAGRTRRVMDSLLLSLETRVASLINNTANVGSSSNTASSWTDATNSTPLADVMTAIRNVERSTGYRPTDILFGGNAWERFTQANQVRNAAMDPNVSGGGPFASVEKVKALLEVKRIHVANAFRNTAQLGNAMSLSRIFADHVTAYYRPDAPSLEEPSYGYYLRWQNAQLPNMQVRRHPFDAKRLIEEMDVMYWQDEVITASALAFQIRFTNSSQ